MAKEASDRYDNIKELMLEAKHKKWLTEVNTRMKKLGFN